jgi:hypothetical protein
MHPTPGKGTTHTHLCKCGQKFTNEPAFREHVRTTHSVTQAAAVEDDSFDPTPFLVAAAVSEVISEPAPVYDTPTVDISTPDTSTPDFGGGDSGGGGASSDW